MTPLRPGEVHLWLAEIGAPGEEQLREALVLLDEAERARAGRFLVEHARTEYILSHALLRAVLAEHTGADPRDFMFRTRAHGKPEIEAPREHGSLRFNLSHSRGLAAVAAAVEREVGVDVEQRSERLGLEDLAHSVLSPAGLAAFVAAAPERRRDFFFAQWTLKEALVKARGDGLSLDVRRIHIDLREDLAPERMTLDGVDVSLTWYIHCFRPGPEHAGALVAAARPGEAIAVVEHGRVSPVPGAGGALCA